MTKFDGIAKSSRVKTGGSLTTTDLKKNMQIYKETGRHPILEAQRAAKENAVVALPAHEIDRPHIYMEFAVDGKSIGKMVFELFHDHAPQAVNQMRYRCNPGTAESLQGDKVHKFLGGFAFFGGLSKGGRGGTTSISTVKSIRATIPGCLAVSLDGSGYAISLARALKLEESHQVVGRMIEESAPILDELRAVGSTRSDEPSKRITILRCGPCSHTGVVDTLAGPVVPSDPETLKKMSETTRDAVADAVAAGLGAKRKAEAQGGAGSGAGAEAQGKGGAANSKAKAGGVGMAPVAKKAKGLLDAVLGEISDDSDEDA